MPASSETWSLPPYRCFDAEPRQRELAAQLHDGVRALPLVCPHGHVDPWLLADPERRFGSPTDLLVTPDHYVLRMLHSQGVRLEDLGLIPRDGGSAETDPRRAWQCFAKHFHLFRGTPTGLWLAAELVEVFGVTQRLDGANAQRVYDELESKLASPEYTPRALFERFGIEVLCTTDAATDTLEPHRRLRADGWTRVRPTLRPDAVVNLDTPGWAGHIGRLGEVSGVAVEDYRGFLAALEQRRAFFREQGATATDHAAASAHTERLSDREAGELFTRALRGTASADDARRFTGHMLVELARMSVEDGLVMQLHVGSRRNHNALLHERFGPDHGSDIPVAVDWTGGLHALLNAFGNDPRLRLILFTLDESTISRELAPLAGHYPAVLLGPPWWFLDSVNGINRYLDAAVETAGLRNLAGFNDDTRAFPSIPARHDVWRRVTCNWLAGLALRGLIDEDDAPSMAADLAYGLAKSAYRL